MYAWLQQFALWQRFLALAWLQRSFRYNSLWPAYHEPCKAYETHMVYSVIMAGGIGSRFWPRSREAHPKQFLNVLGEDTLLQRTFARLEPMVPPERTYVVTHARYENLTQTQLPQLAPSQVLGEPISRNTAPCIAYAAIKLRALDPEAIMVVLPADHLIRRTKRFRKVLNAAIKVARNPGTLVTIGIQPTHPATGYGYIQFDSGNGAEQEIYPVRTFAEKPNLTTAERFLDSGDFLWNSGIFVWRADTILEKMSKHLTSTWEAFESAVPHLNTAQERDAIRKAYHRSARISIDYGVMEHADDVFVVPGSFGWSDIGDWQAVYDLSTKNRHGNVLKGNVIVHDSSRCLVHSEARLVVLVGLHDTVVVDTHDALLVCHKDSTQQVKHVVEYLHAHQLKEFV